MTTPRSLVPDAKLGILYHVHFDGEDWAVLHERVTNPNGLDALAAQSLLRAIGLLDRATKLRFRLQHWGLETDGVPRMPSWRVTLYPGDVLDADDLYSLLVAVIPADAVVEFRAAGPQAVEVIERIHLWFTHPDLGGRQ